MRKEIFISNLVILDPPINSLLYRNCLARGTLLWAIRMKDVWQIRPPNGTFVRLMALFETRVYATERTSVDP